jgi:hypothetical protein
MSVTAIASPMPRLPPDMTSVRSMSESSRLGIVLLGDRFAGASVDDGRSVISLLISPVTLDGIGILIFCKYGNHR